MTLLQTSIVLGLFVCHCCSFTWQNTSDMTELIVKRLQNRERYDPNIMPLAPDNGDPLKVKLNMLVRNIDIDEKEMKILVDLTFRMSWKDYRLQFPYQQDVEYIQFNDYTKIWTPDPFFKASDDTRLLKTFGPESLVRINHTGHVLLSSRMTIKTHCPMDLTYFPHDSQQCCIKVASYGYTTDRILFESMMNDPIQMIKNSVHSNRFDISSYGVEKCDSETVTGSYSCLAVNLFLFRTFSSYLLEWYIPCASFVLISFLSHLMPSDEVVARILLTLTPLLALGVSTIHYSATLPSVPYTTAYDLFTTVSFLAIFFSLLHVTVAYYFAIKHKSKKDTSAEEDEAQETCWEKMQAVFGKRADCGFRMLIIGFYLLFLVLYHIEYNL